jgi:hypothetical protein
METLTPLADILSAQHSPAEPTAAYSRPPDHAGSPDSIAKRLFLLPEHLHLAEGEAAIEWLIRRDEKIKAGRQVLGTAHLPRVQGELNPCFQWLLESFFGHVPDFLIILDHNYWFGSSPLLREILVYHELTHCIHKKDAFGDPLYDENDRPRWGLRGHDVEEFTAVVRRYGAWNADLDAFIAAAQAHSFTAWTAPTPPARD